MKKAFAICIIILFCAGLAACQSQGVDMPQDDLPGGQGGPPSGGLPEEKLPEEAAPGEREPEELPPVAGETVLFTDSLEREVPLPQALYAIAPGNEEAQAILFSIAPDKLAGWYAEPLVGKGVELPAAYAGLPTLGGKGGGLDVEAAKAAGAEAILFMGSAMDAAELDALSESAGLPVLFVDSGLDSIAVAYRTLGGLFGMEEAMEERVEYLEQAVAGLIKYSAAVKESERLSMYIGAGKDGLIPTDSDIITLAAAKNAVGQESNSITLEELKKLPIDGVVLSDESAFHAAVKGQGPWAESQLEAVRMGLVYEAPGALFSWIEGATTPDKIMGAQWLGNLLYPDIYAYHMVEETKLHYDFFWNCQLTDEEAAALLQNSTLKPRG